MMKELLPKVRKRRLARVSVSPELLLDLLKVPPEGIRIDGTLIKSCGDVLPWSATALRAAIDHYGNVSLLVEDDSFEEVYEGNLMPELRLSYSQQ